MTYRHKKQLWQIHGKWYDLKDYMKRHPGGEEILKQTQGQGDLSALFETYHAFSEIESLHEMISKFEVEKSQIVKEEGEEDSEDESIATVTEHTQNSDTDSETDNYLYFEKQFEKITEWRDSPPISDTEMEQEEQDENVSLHRQQMAMEKWGEFDFTSYRELANRVKQIFPDRNSIKAPLEWVAITGYMTALFLFTFFNALFATDTQFQTILPLPLSWMSAEEQIVQIRTFMVVIASISWLSLGFNVMHDASHYAISITPSWNSILSKKWTA